MKKKKSIPFIVTVQLEIVEIKVFATNKTEAKKKALQKLSKKNPVKLIHTCYPGCRKDIFVDKI